MSFVNNTPWSAIDVPAVAPTGHEVVIVVVKATFTVRPDGSVAPADEQAPPRIGDVAWDADDPRSSLRYPSDICTAKQGADLVVVGEAVSRTPVASVDVAVKVRTRVVPLLVHGERFFCKSALRLVVGPAARFTSMPIVYERAYGGATDDYALVHPFNPSGVGVAKKAADLEGTRAPQIEHPARRHEHAGDEHPPVGLGAIMTHWSPRKEHAGTFDEAWKAQRMPILPADFDLRFHNVAPPALQLDTPFAPGEAVAILGMTLDEALRFELPDLGITFRARSDESGVTSVRGVVDTVLVEPSLRRVELTMRATFRLGRGRDVLREVVADVDG